MRVVSDFSECLNAEKPITINQSGNAMSGEYEGELCLGMPAYDNWLRFRMGLFHLGGSYYSLSGIQMDETGGQDVLSGSAVMIGGHLEMVITIVRLYKQDNGINEGEVLLSSQMGQIKWDEDNNQYNLSIVETKQYRDIDVEDIGDDYSTLVEIECPSPE